MKIKVNHLTKKYGVTKALDNVNMILDKGIHGLLGPNGAGKTTFMRILATLIPKSSGEIYFDDISVENKKEIRKIIGYLPQEFAFYPNFTVYEVVDYFAALSNKKLSRKEILSRLEEVHLEEAHKVKAKTLSGGMKRRLGIAVAMVGNPEVLIVDEPTAGLDPEERVRFRNMLSQFGKNRIVLLSTHIAEDVALSCKSIVVLNKGKIVYDGTVGDMIEQSKGLVWNFSVDIDKVDEYRNRFIVTSSIIDGNKVILKVLSKDKPSKDAKMISPTLEDAYMKLMKEV